MTFYDCHTYITRDCPDTVRIVNYDQNESLRKDLFYSVGIHPWTVTTKAEMYVLFEKIKQQTALPNVLAVGECGLDKVRKNDFLLQKELFAMQIGLANYLHKPLIVHCVHAFGETVELLHKATVPVIIHGVNNKIEKMTPFVQKGFFMSFGKALLKEKSVARETIRKIPLSQLLLETDDWDIPVADIYEETAQLLEMPCRKLLSQVENNFISAFGMITASGRMECN